MKIKNVGTPLYLRTVKYYISEKCMTSISSLHCGVGNIFDCLIRFVFINYTFASLWSCTVCLSISEVLAVSIFKYNLTNLTLNNLKAPICWRIFFCVLLCYIMCRLIAIVLKTGSDR